jgi:hypothetical protein
MFREGIIINVTVCKYEYLSLYKFKDLYSLKKIVPHFDDNN